MDNFIGYFTELIGGISAVFALISIFLISKRFKEQRNGDFENNYNKILNELKSINKSNTSEVIDREYALMVQYHSQGLAQSRISFWFSLIFAALGFIIILTGIFSINSINTNLHKPIIAIISGTIVDAVSALFFIQSNKARQLMIEFFDKLRTDRKIEESILLSDEIPNEEIKSKLKAILSLSFADIKTDYHILTQYLQDDKKNNINN